jgi:carbon storage regulator CsrA
VSYLDISGAAPAPELTGDSAGVGSPTFASEIDTRPRCQRCGVLLAEDDGSYYCPDCWEELMDAAGDLEARSSSDALDTEDAMLVLSRKVGEEIVIGDNIRLMVLSIDRGVVRLGISAPRDVAIVRSELLEYDPGRTPDGRLDDACQEQLYRDHGGEGGHGS